MRLLPTLTLFAASVAAATTASAGDVVLVARGTVTAVTGGVPPAPFNAASPGDPVEFTVEATGAPFVNSPGFWEYDTDPLRGGVQIGSAFVPVLPGDVGVVNVMDGPIDGVSFGVALSGPFISAGVVGLFDFSGTFLSSPDITLLTGQTMTGSFPGTSIIGTSVNAAQIEIEIQTISFDVSDCPIIGTSSCAAEDNSTGEKAFTTACGSLAASQNNLVLSAYGLPQNTFGFFLCSQTSGFIPMPGGSAGNLCVAGSIGRFVGPGQIRASGTLGTISLDVDVTQLPSPNGPIAAAAGATWYFTAWYRDVNSLGTSNFSDRREITFQ